MIWRSDRIRLALTLLYLAMAMFVGTSLTMAIDDLIGNTLSALPTTTAMLGVSLLLLASVQLTREAHAALRGNGLEIAYFAELKKRRQKLPESNLDAAVK